MINIQKIKPVVIGLMFMGSLMTAHNAYAGIANVSTKVVRVLHTNSDVYGACMARLAKDPATTGVDCNPWVTFSCTGDFTTKDSAYRMFDMAQMSLALDKAVTVWVNDSKKHNGFCVAERIEVLK